MTLDPLSGRSTYALIELETEYGQRPSPFPGTTHQYVHFTSEDFDKRMDNLVSPRLSSERVPWTRVYRTNQYVEGTLIFELGYKGAELLLQAAWGERKTTNFARNQAPEVYNHLFLTAADLPSFTMEVGFGKRALQLYGCVINTITLTALSMGFVVCKLTVVAQRAELFRVPSAEVPVRTPVIHDQMITGTHHGGMILIWYSESPGTETYIPSLSSFEATLDNKLRIAYPLGSDLMKKPARGDYRQVSGRFVGEFNDPAFDAFRHYSSAQKCVWIQYATNGVNVPIPTGPGSNPNGNVPGYDFTIEYRGNKLDLRSATPKIMDTGVVILDVPFEGYYDVSGTQSPPNPPELLWNDEPFIFRTQNDLNGLLLSALQRST